eukprot:scaffold4052_cov123-Skeletonema_dohrnii-CCMP3373.AAC.6
MAPERWAQGLIFKLPLVGPVEAPRSKKVQAILSLYPTSKTEASSVVSAGWVGWQKQKRIVQSSDEQWVLYLLSVCHHVPDYKSDAVAEGKEGREKTLVPGQVSRGRRDRQLQGKRTAQR